mmetsp:Transcript_125530/g.360885  ORF Transcript_125530/g.360885 Transcript_125530/m.360885 type:complete len:171 (-) Transcript_125530:102-614(-)
MKREFIDEMQFLSKFTELFEANRAKGTVYFQIKRYQGRLASVRRRWPLRQAEAAKDEEPRCLVRAYSNVPKTVMTAVILAKDLVKFQLAMGNVLRANMMDGLKKREKTKEERQRERAERKRKAKQDAPEKAAKTEEGSPKAEAKAAAGKSSPSKAQPSGKASAKKAAGKK